MADLGASRQIAAQRRYVCVHNRNRDEYEVALALAEAGLLEALTTDIYAPDWWPERLLGPLVRRRRAGLAARSVRSQPLAALVQYAGLALGLEPGRIFALTDRLLGNAAARLARQTGCGLYAYSSYLAPGLAVPVPTIDFEYHPDPGLSLEILEADCAVHAAVSWSLARERAVTETAGANPAWRLADAVVCASSMTRRSLIHAGCPADRIAVIPYGAAPGSTVPAQRPAGPCRFLFVGQGIQRKGLHHLALAWRAAGLTNAELTIASYVIDPGIEPLLDQPGIVRLGRQSQADLARCFERADVFVMPSLVEGFGLVYLEALQAGCHAVGTANTGLPDLALSDAAATIVTPGAIEELAQTLVGLADRKAIGGFDPAAVSSEAQRRTWADFRREIAAHATGLFNVTGVC